VLAGVGRGAAVVIPGYVWLEEAFDRTRSSPLSMRARSEPPPPLAVSLRRSLRKNLSLPRPPRHTSLPEPP
jgi:hypothetical protein